MDLSDEIQTLLNMMSIQGKLRLVGSSRQKNILYSGDFDCNETVLIRPNTAGIFQKHIKKIEKHPHTYIMDFKAGIVPKFAVLSGELNKEGKLVGFDKEQSKTIFSALKEFIPAPEYAEGVALLDGINSGMDWMEAKSFFKYQFVHWSVSEILAGKKTHYGADVDLAESFEQNAPVKLDIVSLLYNNRFVELTCIYMMKKGKRFISPPGELENIENDALFYLESKNYYKYLKRVYSLSVIHENTDLSAKLEDFFNSKNGLLYVFAVSLEVLIHMYENLKNIPAKKVNYELDIFRTFISKYGKEEFATELEALRNGINASKLSKLHQSAYDLLQVRTKAFLQELEGIGPIE